jgi:hypothetical protein
MILQKESKSANTGNLIAFIYFNQYFSIYVNMRKWQLVHASPRFSITATVVVELNGNVIE